MKIGLVSHFEKGEDAAAPPLPNTSHVRHANTLVLENPNWVAARAVASSRKNRGGVAAWGHHLAMTALEFQATGPPIPVGERSCDPALFIVQDAPISGQCATGRGSDQFIEGGDTVLMGHG